MKHVVFISLICTVLAVISANAMAFDTLKHNPFEQPDLTSGLSQKNVNNVAASEMKLRGTVIDGEDSLVNINGAFYRLNQKVAGYRVIRISSASVTLRRGNNETVLTLNNDK